MSDLEVQSSYEDLDRGSFERMKSLIDNSSLQVQTFLDSVVDLSLYEPVFRDGLNIRERYSEINSLPELDVELFHAKVDEYVSRINDLKVFITNSKELNLSPEDNSYLDSLNQELDALYQRPSFFPQVLVSEIAVLQEYYMSLIAPSNSFTEELTNFRNQLELFKLLNSRFFAARSLRLKEQVDDLNEYNENEKLNVANDVAFKLYNKFLSNGYFNRLFIDVISFDIFLESDLFFDIKNVVFDNYRDSCELNFQDSDDLVLYSGGFIKPMSFEINFGDSLAEFDLSQYYHPYYHRNISGMNLFQKMDEADLVSVIDISDVTMDNLSSILEINEALKASGFGTADYNSVSHLAPFWSAIKSFRDERVLDDKQLEVLITNAFKANWSMIKELLPEDAQQAEYISSLEQADVLLDNQFPGLRDEIEELYDEYLEYYNTDHFDVRRFKSRYGKRLKGILEDYL